MFLSYKSHLCLQIICKCYKGTIIMDKFIPSANNKQNIIKRAIILPKQTPSTDNGNIIKGPLSWQSSLPVKAIQ